MVIHVLNGAVVVIVVGMLFKYVLSRERLPVLTPLSSLR